LKVLVITYYWPPSGGAGVQRTLKFTRYLPSFGIEPVVLTVDPAIASYPQLDVSLTKEVSAGLKVVTTNSFEPLSILSKVAGKDKVPYGGFANVKQETFFQKSLRWIRGNFFIPDARVGWVKYAVAAAEKIISEENISCVYISSPPHSSQLIGLALKKKFPTLKWIADLRDPWTKIYYYKELLHTSFAAKKDFSFERKVLEQCDAAIVVSASIRRDFAGAHPQIDAKKIHVLPNGFDEADFEKSYGSDQSKFIITYVGTIADSYKPEVFFAALKKFIAANKSSEILFRFIGSATPAIRNLVTASGLESNCEWVSYVPHERAIEYMKQSSLLLLIIPDVAGADGILTGKLFEYIGSGKPVLGIGPVKGDAAVILDSCEAGRFFARGEEENIVAYLNSTYLLFKSTDREQLHGAATRSKYSRRVLTEQLAEMIKMLVNAGY
jgi:glycosyltransferase involved in cell wall biosynthesis